MKITHAARVALGAAGVLTALGAAAPQTALGAAAPQTARAATLDAPLTQMLAAHPKTGVSAVIARTHGPLTSARLRSLTALGADVTRHLSLIHSVALTVPRRNLSRLAALSFVAHLSYDGQIKKCDEFTVGSSGAGTAYTHYGLDGTGVTVAVVDSGMRFMHPDIRKGTTTASRVLYTQDFITNQGFAAGKEPTGIVTDDTCGHGTHVAGIIGGNGNMSTGTQYTHTFYGIARNCNLANVRVLDGNGQGNVSTVVSGLQWSPTRRGTTSGSSTSRSATRSAKAIPPIPCARPSRPLIRPASSSSAPQATTGG